MRNQESFCFLFQKEELVFFVFFLKKAPNHRCGMSVRRLELGWPMPLGLRGINIVVFIAG
jgi:hypothetical protein